MDRGTLKWRLGRRATLTLGAALVAMAAAGIAYATIPDGNGVFTACKLSATGTIRLIDPSLTAIMSEKVTGALIGAVPEGDSNRGHLPWLLR